MKTTDFDAFLFGRETTDSYTLAASPNFGNRLGHVRSIIYSSFGGHSKDSVDLDAKSPFLVDRISGIQSSWSGKSHVSTQLTGELPIGHGCSFTQTVFNGQLTFKDFVFEILDCFFLF